MACGLATTDHNCHTILSIPDPSVVPNVDGGKGVGGKLFSPSCSFLFPALHFLFFLDNVNIPWHCFLFSHSSHLSFRGGEGWVLGDFPHLYGFYIFVNKVYDSWTDGVLIPCDSPSCCCRHTTGGGTLNRYLTNCFPSALARE